MKNKKYILLTMTIILAWGCLKKIDYKNTDWGKFNLNGKVKEVYETKYKLIDGKENLLSKKRVKQFSKTGMLSEKYEDKKIKQYKYKHGKLIKKIVANEKKLLIGSFSYEYNKSGLLKITKYFDGEGKIQKKWIEQYSKGLNTFSRIFDLQNKIIEIWKYVYDNEKNKVKEIIFDKNMTIKEQHIFDYDDNTNIIFYQELFFDNTQKEKTKYVYSKNNLLIKIYKYDYSDELEWLCILNYDKQNRLFEEKYYDMNNYLLKKLTYSYYNDSNVRQIMLNNYLVNKNITNITRFNYSFW